MAVVIVATIIPKPEHREEVVAAIEAAIPHVHQEPGCELYALHEAKDRLVMIEKWADRDAVAAHGQSPAFSELSKHLDSWLESPMEVRVLRPHPAGDPARGAL